MICVEDLPRFPAVIDVVAQAQAERTSPFDSVVELAKAMAQGRGVPFEAQIVAGHPVSSNCRGSSSAAAMICSVVGYLGHSALYDHLIGSTADRLDCARALHGGCREMGARSGAAGSVSPRRARVAA